MKKFLRWLDINFEPLCMTVMFYLMSGLMVLQVILRFAFHTGFAWGEEVSRFIFVWLVFLSSSDDHCGCCSLNDVCTVSEGLRAGGETCALLRRYRSDLERKSERGL